MIVGNKIDMEDARTVSKQRGLDYAESKKIAFYEVSAKDGTNINLVFTRIAEGNFSFMQSFRKPFNSRKDKNLSNKLKENNLWRHPLRKQSNRNPSFSTKRWRNCVNKKLSKVVKKNAVPDISSLCYWQLNEALNPFFLQLILRVHEFNSKIVLKTYHIHINLIYMEK